MGELFSGLIARAEVSGERAMLTVIAYLAVALLLLASFGGFSYAMATAISQAYGPVVAALSVGAASLVAALVVIGWLRFRALRIRRRVVMRSSMQPIVATAATDLLPAMLRASPLGTLAAVAAAAYVVAKASQPPPDRRP